MTRLSKNQVKVALSFCTLFALYFPVAFSQQVDTAWVRRYNGPGNGDDEATAVTVDSSGNVYVTGSCFDSTGYYDYCTIKYLPNGDTAWLRKYNGPGGFGDYAYAMAVDSSGNVYVAGESNGIGTSQDFATIKYYPNGDTAWVRRYNGPGNDNEEKPSLTIDNSGNVYITGRSADVGSVSDYATIKYDSLGNEVWVARYNGPADSDDHSNAIAVDTLGNVYVTGRSLADTTYDYATIKYAPNGDTLWVRRYDGPANDIARAIALDGAGNAYVTGGSGGNFLSIKYDSLGGLVWAETFVHPFDFGNPDEAGGYALAVDEHENVYVVGQDWDLENLATFLVKYDSLGNQLWYVRRTLQSSNDFSIELDSVGNIYAVNNDGIVSKYDQQGNEIWSQYDQYGNLQSSDLTLDAKGNIYLSGHGLGSGTGLDFITIKYSPLPQINGDLNLDGNLSSADVVLMLNCAFLGEAPPAAPSACDINCDGAVTAADAVILLQMVFLSAPAPC